MHILGFKRASRSAWRAGDTSTKTRLSELGNIRQVEKIPSSIRWGVVIELAPQICCLFLNFSFQLRLYGPGAQRCCGHHYLFFNWQQSKLAVKLVSSPGSFSSEQCCASGSPEVLSYTQLKNCTSCTRKKEQNLPIFINIFSSPCWKKCRVRGKTPLFSNVSLPGPKSYD